MSAPFFRMRHGDMMLKNGKGFDGGEGKVNVQAGSRGEAR